ncbi:hypothetical protein MTO96_005900 [Rhipicephalus appendiculatus]
MIEEDSEVNPCSKVTIRRKSRNTRSSAGRRSSLLATTPVAPDIDQDSDSAVPTFKVVDEEASILLREGHWTGEDRGLCRVRSFATSRQGSKGPAAPCKRVRGQGCLKFLCSLGLGSLKLCARIHATPGVAARQISAPSESPSSLSSTALLERAFMESPTSTLRRQGGDLASLEITAPIDLDAPIVEAAPRRQSARKSCMSRASDVKKSSRVTFVVNKARETMAAAREVPQDLTPVTAESEEPQKAPHRATYFVSKSEEKTDALQHKGLGDVKPRTGNTEAHVVERDGDLPEKNEIEAVDAGDTVDKEVSQKADSLSKKARRTGKKSRSKAREVSPAETEPPRKSNGVLNVEPMDVGASSSTDEDGATRSSSGRPSRRNVQHKSYKEPSIHTKLRRP